MKRNLKNTSSRIFNSIGRPEKPPYLLTLLFALMVYSINNLVNHELEAPTICYSRTDITPVDKQTFHQDIQSRYDYENENHLSLDLFKTLKQKLVIENISLSSEVRDITILIKFRDTDKGRKNAFLFDGRLTAISPAALPLSNSGDTSYDRTEHHIPTSELQFNITEFQPNTKYEITYYAAYDQHIQNKPALYVKSSAVIRFREKGLEDWLVINRYLINLGLLAFIVLLLILYAYGSIKISAKNNAANLDN